MPRQLRVQTPGIHHITSRGNNKQVIFDDTLRGGFLGHLADVASAFDWGVLGWVLMTNHFHLVVEVGDLGLARGMHRLNLGLALAANARFGRINHNSGDRYWNKPLEDEAPCTSASAT